MTNWIHTDNKFKLILHKNNDPENEEQSVENTKHELIPHLQSTPCYAELNPQVIKHIEYATTFHTLNRAINEIYDYADDNQIWLGFMPM